MTKEELKQEAEEYFKSICEDYNEEYERTGKRHYFVGFDIKNAYIASAEPREKRIAKLESQNKELKKWLKEKFESCESENLSFVAKYDTACQELDSCKAKIAELEAQIEKMKMCQNCKSESKDYTEKPCRDCSRCLGDIKREGNSDNWELAE